MVNRKTGIFSMEVKKTVDKGVRKGMRNAETLMHAYTNFLLFGLMGMPKQTLSRGGIHSARGLIHPSNPPHFPCGAFTVGMVMHGIDLGILFLTPCALNA